ncbi:MAG: PAS domain S-box protein [bacterium]
MAQHIVEDFRGMGMATAIPPGEVNSLYKLLVDSVRDYAIFALDPTGHILTWNAGAERFKGYSAADIIGQHFSIFYTEADRKADRPGLELIEAAAAGRVEDEGFRVRKDGSQFWANVVITALRDGDGTLVGFAKVTRDLTDRRAAEEALRSSERRFRLLVQGVRDYGIFMLDPTGVIVSWNEGAQRIKGYSAAQIIGKHFSTFYTAEDLATDKPGMELEVAGRVGRFEDEGWRVRRDGTLFWANVVITAVHDDSGTLMGFSKVTRDLTERRAAESRSREDLRRVTEAEAANKTKTEFLASMSHELRTPLNAISGYVDLLLAGVTGEMSPTQEDYLQRVRRSQQHLLAIINDLLNYSRIEAGRLDYDLRPMVLNEPVRRVLTMIDSQAKQRSVDLSLDGSTCHAVVGDLQKVEQILVNLVFNAIKFTPAGGSITISCFDRDDVSGVRVTDTGVGISALEHQSIFEPFVQLGRTHSSQHEGTGLGLAISRTLARGMGGDLTVRSALGEGSTFELTLRREVAE